MTTLTFDKNTFSSNREIDDNGYLRVEGCNITKTQVAPYLGREIPGWKEMGLDSNEIYYVLRPEEELKKAAPTFNNLPLTREHIEVDVENVPKEKIVGSLGDHTQYADGYLKNNLIIYDKKDIDLVMSGKKKELSCGYRYIPVRQHGIFDGKPYDFIMTNIIGNHVALVKEGRAGHDVVVRDTISTIKESIMNIFKKKTEVVEDEKSDDIQWITVNGNHVPVGKGQSKEEAVKSFIESKKESSKENEEYKKRAEKAKKEFKNDFDVASPEQFKELTGLTPAEFEKKYPVKSKSNDLDGKSREEIEEMYDDALAEYKEAVKNKDEVGKQIFKKRLDKIDAYMEENDSNSKESKNDLTGKSFMVKMARKPSDMGDIKSNETHGGYSDVKISETIELSGEEYDRFTKHPLRDYDFLKGKGGYDDDGNRTAVALRSKGKKTLLVDPSGSSYGRYVGILYADSDSKGANDESFENKNCVIMMEITNDEIPLEEVKPQEAGEEIADKQGEVEMTEEVKETPVEAVEEVKVEEPAEQPAEQPAEAKTPTEAPMAEDSVEELAQDAWGEETEYNGQKGHYLTTKSGHHIFIPNGTTTKEAISKHFDELRNQKQKEVGEDPWRDKYSYGEAKRGLERAKQSIGSSLGKAAAADLDKMISELENKMVISEAMEKEYNAKIHEIYEECSKALKEAEIESNEGKPESKIKEETEYEDIEFKAPRPREKVEKSAYSERDWESPELVDIGVPESDNVSYDILDSVMGQMSDGMWENSRAVEKYWRNANIDKKDGTIGIKVNMDTSWRGRSPYGNMSDEEIRGYFAKKIKAVAKEELGENGDWSRNNETELQYLSRSNRKPVRVKDAYKLYDHLLGRNKK